MTLAPILTKNSPLHLEPKRTALYVVVCDRLTLTHYPCVPNFCRSWLLVILLLSPHVNSTCA